MGGRIRDSGLITKTEVRTVWCFIPIISALRRLSQVDPHKLDKSLGYILSSQAGLHRENK